VDVREVEIEFLEETRLAREVRDAAEFSANALPGDTLELVDIALAALAGLGDDSLADGVFAAGLQAACTAQDLVLAVAVQRDDVGDGEFALRERSGLVESDDVDLAHRLKATTTGV